ncbi:hypothetical protein G5V59_11725 [Nocardioides sp. W3-2-3]|nr:hypothetical protein [Nocardioides convexus]
MIEIEERLAALAQDAPLPGGAVADDVRRGRQRLRARRLAVTGGVVAAAVVAGLAWSGPASEPADRQAVEPPPATKPALAAVVDGLTRAADDDGDGSVDASEMIALAQRSQPGRKGGTVFRFDTGTQWATVVGRPCPPGWTCGPATLPGADRAAVAVSRDFTQVAAAYGDDVYVITLLERDSLTLEQVRRAVLAYVVPRS